MTTYTERPTDNAVPTHRAELRGRASGVTILAFFALAWTSWGTGGHVPATTGVLIVVVAALVSATLVAWAWTLYRRATSTNQISTGNAMTGAPMNGTAMTGNAATATGGATASARPVGRRFGLIVASEWIGLGLAAGVAGGTGHAWAIPVLICAGVGVHFFPLAGLFHVPLYNATGVALCVIAVATIVLAPVTGTAALWTTLPGIGAALALYATCAVLVRDNARLHA